jgi:hypothetical protein
MSVSAIILNFNRPDYITDYIIPALNKIKEINEIVISNGKEETAIKTSKYSPDYLKLIDHHGDMNKEYGLTLRFLTALEAKNKYVMIMDDDIIPTPETIKFLLERVKTEPGRIHGFYGRDISVSKDTGVESYSYENVFGEVPIVLTRCLMTTQEKCKYFIDNFRFYETDLIKKSKPYWNGEDILFSLLSIQSTGKLNRAYNLSHTNRVLNYLNPGTSISIGGDHIHYREKLTLDLLQTMAIGDIIRQEKKIVKKKYQITYFLENTDLAKYLFFGLLGNYV